mmetsp:Transcript_22227/g.52926  ORF Transcript_22227/g.52926 Transcript_22227/m.52926 type:complete len:88 (-) Transcript_22227:237-500(-)
MKRWTLQVVSTGLCTMAAWVRYNSCFDLSQPSLSHVGPSPSLFFVRLWCKRQLQVMQQRAVRYCRNTAQTQPLHSREDWAPMMLSQH